jgi:hypothetical protein
VIGGVCGRGGVYGRVAPTWRTDLSVAVLAACVAVLAGVLLSGCAGGAAVSSVVDPVAQAARFTELAPGYKVSIGERVTVPRFSKVVTGSGSGVVDRRHGHAVMAMKVESKGHTYTTKEQFAGGTLYIHSSYHGKPWIAFNVNSVDAAVGIDDLTSSGSGESFNPSSFLSYLRAAGARATRIGVGQVQGVSTTHYRATIDYARYASRVPPSQRIAARASVAALERLTGSHTQAVDVWIDQQHRVRREAFAYHECEPGGGTFEMRMTMEFSDFGVQAIAALPARSEVSNVTSKIVNKLKHVKFGCFQGQ